MGEGKILGITRAMEREHKAPIVVSARTANSLSLAASLGYLVKPIMAEDILIYKRIEEPGSGAIIKRQGLRRWLSRRHNIQIGDTGLEWSRENLCQ